MRVHAGRDYATATVQTMSITFQNVSKNYGDGPPAIDGISFQVESGELAVLLGESGCGKTTTLKLINRLIDASAGQIFVDGQDIRRADAVKLRRNTGYVFQGIGLFPHMTISENIAITLRLMQRPDSEVRERVDELLELVRLSAPDYRDRMPQELSGGQQQRVGLARALAARPQVMLLDEAFGALDPLTRDQLRDEFRELHDSLALTSVLVTHDISEALLLADHVIVIKSGRIEQNGTPGDLVASPATEYVEKLLSTPKRQSRQLETMMANARSVD